MVRELSIKVMKFLRCLESLKEEEPESMKWVAQYADANQVKTDFFEARSSAYAKSSAIEDDLDQL